MVHIPLVEKKYSIAECGVILGSIVITIYGAFDPCGTFQVPECSHRPPHGDWINAEGAYTAQL
jgi:hypothetical protein